jgi:transposase-like protein
MFATASRSDSAQAQEMKMARIKRDDHARILQMVDVERRRVADIAAEYGCSTANIHALVGKLRRRTAGEQAAATAVQTPLALDQAQVVEAAPLAADANDDVVEASGPEPETPADARLNVIAFERDTAPVAPEAMNRPPRLEVAPPQVTVVSKPSSDAGPLYRPTASGGGTAAIGARLAKPGFGLIMRTADGEENMTPFRSLDELLSAIKPILRASARSSEPVWFSLRPVDLATIDIDAA